MAPSSGRIKRRYRHPNNSCHRGHNLSTKHARGKTERNLSLEALDVELEVVLVRHPDAVAQVGLLQLLQLLQQLELRGRRNQAVVGVHL